MSAAHHLGLFAVAVGLGLAPVPGAQAQSPATDAASVQTTSLSELLLELGRAQQLADEDPQVGAPRLAAVLAEVHNYPAELAQDDAAQAARLEGLLILARAQLNLGQDAKAAATLDEALRCAHGQALDAARLGPSLGKLEQERRQAIGASTPLKVSCSVPCRIYVDEREAGPDLQLPTGAYRVTVLAATDGQAPAELEPLVTQVEIAAGGPAVELRYGPAPEPAATAEGPDPAHSSDPAQTSARAPASEGRLLPRWAEITGLGLGLAAVGAGVGLLVIDGDCKGGGSVTGPNACDDLYKTDLPGFVAVGAGSALVLSAAVLLGIDEGRAKRARAALAPTPSGLVLHF